MHTRIGREPKQAIRLGSSGLKFVSPIFSLSH
jgi:hypothetical protein